MAVFGLEWQNVKGDEYMESMSKKLISPDPKDSKSVGLLFLRGNVKKMKGFYVVRIEPTLPPIYLFPLIPILGMLVFGVTLWWAYAILLGIMAFSCLWWIDSWYSFLLKLGYKRQMKERAEVTVITGDKLLVKVMGWDR